MTTHSPSRTLLATTLALSLSGCALMQNTKVEPRPPGRTPVLWMDPAPVATRDLFWGPGSSERAPRPPFAFLEEDTGGTQPKVIVRDAAGREWTAKFGEEVHSGIAANRLVWALGYAADELYFVTDGVIAGVTALERGREFIGAGGVFTNASFRLRDARAPRADERWTFEHNPFVRSKELSGLAVLMTMLANWDIQGTRNNRILEDGARDLYIVSDLGATFGRMGTFPMPRSKWDIEDFGKEGVIDGVGEGVVDLDYDGYGGIGNVPLEHARWFAALAAQLTDHQLREGFRAAGASQAEIHAFAARMRARIDELVGATGAAGTY
ncbi:MAG: hypothetical protein H0X44_05655 [Acidobacteria bacterium]|nr:hypothetical protein [Acidobacteriota bacterium]